jgi:hypothetical protein
MSQTTASIASAKDVISHANLAIAMKMFATNAHFEERSQETSYRWPSWSSDAPFLLSMRCFATCHLWQSEHLEKAEGCFNQKCTFFEK